MRVHIHLHGLYTHGMSATHRAELEGGERFAVRPWVKSKGFALQPANYQTSDDRRTMRAEWKVKLALAQTVCSFLGFFLNCKLMLNFVCLAMPRGPPVRA